MPSSPSEVHLPAALASPIKAQLHVQVEGEKQEYTSELTLTDSGLRVAVGEEVYEVADEMLDGVGYSNGSLFIYYGDGEVLQLSGTPLLAATAQHITGRVCVLPEMTRPLLTLGSQRGKPGEEHDLFWTPLLQARQRAEKASDASGRMTAFGAGALRAALERSIEELAARRFPGSDPERRALSEQLRELAEPLHAALQTLERGTAAVRDGGEQQRFAAWRAWRECVRQLFGTADETWRRMLELLQSIQPRRQAFWRRMLPFLGSAIMLCALASGALAQHRTFRVTGVPADSARRLDFDVVSAADDFVIIVASEYDQDRLSTLGWQRTPLDPAARPAADPRYATTEGNVYRSFDDPERGVRFFMDSIATANARVHLDTIGFTFENRPMLAAKVGAADDSPARPNVIIMATYHAREWAASEMAMRLLRYLADSPPTDVRVDSLLNRRDIWILPVVNADGYEYTFTNNRLWRKNRRPVGGGVTGVDLNRNHAYLWGKDNQGSSGNTRSETYRGPAPASEVETQAVQQFHAAHPPVVSISYHTFTGLLLYPPGNTFGQMPADLSIFRALAGQGTNSAVQDHLPGALNPFYHPGPGWNLYTTNGEYTDWAYATHGTIAFTPELTSGYTNGQYYGFQFPEDESLLQTVFLDNLPFALDVIESAADPASYVSPTTGLAAGTTALESISPQVRVRVPFDRAASAAATAGGPLHLRVEAAANGEFSRRLVSQPVSRPGAVTLSSSGLESAFRLLAAAGAEIGETGWTSDGFGVDTGAPAGLRYWRSGQGTLRSPSFSVPADMDTVSVLFLARYFGGSYNNQRRAFIRASLDGGLSFQTFGSLAGEAEAFYPERVVIPGVAGRTLMLEIETRNMTLHLDEITVVAHSDTRPAALKAINLTPSANPVRGDMVHFPWPYEQRGGELLFYDFAGRLALRQDIMAGSDLITVNVADARLANGVYVVVARSQGESTRLTLYIVR